MKTIFIFLFCFFIYLNPGLNSCVAAVDGEREDKIDIGLLRKVSSTYANPGVIPSCAAHSLQTVNIWLILNGILLR